MVVHILQKSSPPSCCLHQLAKNSTSTQGNVGGWQPAHSCSPHYWEPWEAFNHTPRLFSSRLGSYSNQGKSTWAECGKEDQKSSDRAAGAMSSSPGRGDEGALTHGRAEARLCGDEPGQAAVTEGTEPPLPCPQPRRQPPHRGTAVLPLTSTPRVAGHDLHAWEHPTDVKRWQPQDNV